MRVDDEAALLDFDRGQLFDWRQDREDRALAEHRDLFCNHLRIAKHLEFWAANLTEHMDLGDAAHNRGFVHALDEMAAFLRLGYYLPGGVFYAVFEPGPWRRWADELESDR